MVQIVAISGSLRKNSFNTNLLRAAAQVAPSRVKLDIYTLQGIPLYDGDLEAASGIPESVQKLKDAIASADGLLISAPEYNNSMSGVLKNGIDWFSRPAEDIPRVWLGKPVGVVGASPGGFGTILAQNSLLPVLKFLGTDPWFAQKMMVSKAHTLFDASGQLIDQATGDRLKTYMDGFTAFVESSTKK